MASIQTLTDILKSHAEKLVFIFLGLTFFIGLWHAFPIVTIINDEMYYTGSVLRAMSNHTIVPLVNDMPYGTLTYLYSYFTSAITLLFLLPFFELKVSLLKTFLIQSPWVMYASLRFFTAFFSFGFLYYVYQLLKSEFEDKKIRIFLLILLFTNVITTVVMHTGKVWVLATLFVVASFYYLYMAIATSVESDDSKLKKNTFLSILFSFLAFANFPLNAFSLINIPILLFYFRKNKQLIRKIFLYTFVGSIIFIVVTLFNFENIKNQFLATFASEHPIHDGGSYIDFLIASLRVYTYKLLMLFPLTLFTLVLLVGTAVRNKKLFIISFIYSVLYLVSVIAVANWSLDPYATLRYFFPFSFFIIFLIASFNIKYKAIFSFIAFVSIIYQLLTLYYISIPTTYNETRDWVINELTNKDVIVINDVPELKLPLNKKSALSLKEIHCGSQCKAIIDHDLNNDFMPLVLNGNISEYSHLDKDDMEIYHVTTEKQSGKTLVTQFSNPAERYYDIDYRLGDYLSSDFLTLKNLGKNIYVYK